MIRQQQKTSRCIGSDRHYEEMISEWDSKSGISYEFRKKQAVKVFKKMSQYNKQFINT